MTIRAGFSVELNGQVIGSERRSEQGAGSANSHRPPASRFFRDQHPSTPAPLFECGLCLPTHLRDQFNRAASSIALNLREGSAKTSTKDRLRFYEIALGSIRECQAIFHLTDEQTGAEILDATAASTYRLCKALQT